MDKNEIYQEVTGLLIKLFEFAADDIPPESRLYEDLELDSIDAVDMVVHLQKKAGTKLSLRCLKPCARFRMWSTRLNNLSAKSKTPCVADDLFRRSRLLTGLMLLAWPFLIGFGLTHNSLHWLLPLMALLLMCRLRQARHNVGDSNALCGVTERCAGGYRAVYGKLSAESAPVAAALSRGRESGHAGCIGGSLWTAMPLVERLARLREPNLPPEGIRYTRNVTHIWCSFFIVNGSIALLTVMKGDMQLWTLWNGMIAYILMGTLMATEWLIRQRVMKKVKRNE